MAFLSADTALIEQTAQDLAGIRNRLDQAVAATAGATTTLTPAAQDEISTTIAALFADFGKQQQALNAQAADFHNNFTNLMKTTAAAFTQTEAANAAPLAAAGDSSDPLTQIEGAIDGFVGNELESTGTTFSDLGFALSQAGFGLSNDAVAVDGDLNTNIAQDTAILNNGFDAPAFGLLLGNVLGVAPEVSFLQTVGSASQFVGNQLAQTGSMLFDAGSPLIDFALAAR